MAEELSYVIINPYTIYKSRTGGVLARLLTRTSLDLVGAQMFAPSQALIDEYAQNIVTEADPQDRQIRESIRDTYGDIVYNRDGGIRYFEPAVLASPNIKEASTKLKIWAKYSDSDGGLLEKALPTVTDPAHQRTLVIIKPDNFKFPSG